jgi:hypothetical protein
MLTNAADAASTAFSSTFDTSAGLAIVATADTASTFGYDYSADGIPEAPNNLGGAATTGLKLEANIVDPATAEEIAVVTTGLGALGGYYSLQVEVWVNANGPFPGGGSGSTEFAGAAIGHDGATAGRNGASLVFDGEGSSSRDYRLYKDAGEQFFASGQYALTDNNNNSGPDMVAAFPGLAAPAAQGQGATVTADGSGGFQWMTLVVDVDATALGSGATADLGVATFTLTSAASGNTVEVGTIDNSNGGTVVSMTGNVGVVFADIFTSVSGNPQYSFGVFDNMSVAIPEPTSLVLLSIGGLVMLRRRR